MGRIVFFSSFFIITFDRLLLVDFSFELALLRLVSPRKCTSLLRLAGLVVLEEQSLLLCVFMIRLRWLFCAFRVQVFLLTSRILLGCLVKPLTRVFSHFDSRFYLFYLQ